MMPSPLGSPVLRAGSLFLFIVLIFGFLIDDTKYIYVANSFLACFQWMQGIFNSPPLQSTTILDKPRRTWDRSIYNLGSVPYEDYILAPASRTLHPMSVYNVNGTVTGAETLMGGRGSAVFHGQSALTLDYEKNIAGVVSLSIGAVSSEMEAIGLTFSESSHWISGLGSDGTAESGIDEVLWIRPSSPGVYTLPREHERGAFRYLSLIHNSTGDLEVKEVTTYFTAMPHYKEAQLRAYTGYFHCDGTSSAVWIYTRTDRAYDYR